jgi:hypothetical protein
MSVLEENISNEIKRNPAIFEPQILACFIGSHSFFLGNNRSICEVLRNNNRRQDFSKNWMNVLYEGVVTYWSGYENIQEGPIPRSILDININQANEQGRLIDRELGDIEASLENIYTLAANNLSSTVRFIENGVLAEWIGIKLTASLINDVSANPISATPDELLSRVSVIKERQSAHEVDETLVTMDMAFAGSVTRGELLHSPWPELDEKVGGGFAKGEHTICASVTGGGKTVLATQLASTFALSGLKVLFATTEQEPVPLIHRMLSDVVDIPFTYFTHSDQVDQVTRLPRNVANDSDWVSGCREFQETTRHNMRFINWSSSRKTVESDLRASIQSWRDWTPPPEPEPGWDLEPNFEPDVLIFDWIGSALAQGREREMRHLYEAVATELKHIAIADNMSVFSFAQLNKMLSKGKAKCDHTMLHECKSLPDQAVNAIYVSGLTNNNQDENGAETFLPGQMLNVAKSRFGPGGSFRIIRQFQHQRFATPDVPN